VKPGLFYRQVEPTDIPAMAGIRAANWGSEQYWTARITAYLDCTLHPQQALLARVIYVALKQDSLVGFIAGHLTRRYGCDGELEWIDVIAERRRSGIATELLRHLAAWFAGQKAARICVDVDPANATARAFYASHGATNLNEHWLVWDPIRIVKRESRSTAAPKGSRLSRRGSTAP
jgi:GNAT superfamily N-acetyltransferase